ncbi:hypothetical protein [Azospirillum sp.]|uniref:hypothetical protein n=1 Tax=Azospirillum sp. TaxID=34012 RepID=UPI002D29C697|nr:hypothetical protein [Azospirillum sp.]HYD69031.1 hypothetical protein [Azospirillum sp.]
MDPAKLAKVLAMAESEHQGEALSALRAARIMLSRAGLTFRDLANAAARPAPDPEPPPTPPQPPVTPPPPDQVVLGLRRQVGDLEREVAALKRQLEKASGDMEKQKEEADRWRTLARETAEKLWDLGKALERRHSRHTTVEKRRAILDHLQDPGSAMLSDQEIARRVGTSVQVVAHWRRRLAIVGRKVRLLPVVPRGRGLWRPQGARMGGMAGGPDNARRRWIGYTGEVTIAERRGKGPR